MEDHLHVSVTARILSENLFLRRHIILTEYWIPVVKSAKLYLSRAVGSIKLTFKEFSSILTRVEACLTAVPELIPVSTADQWRVQKKGGGGAQYAGAPP